jgi:hypothetical protein
MAALRYDIALSADRTFVLRVACKEQDADTLELEIRDLTGWSGAMQIRDTPGGTVLAEADVEVDAATGTVTATVAAADTADATWRSGVFDLIIDDGAGYIDPLVEGVARLRPSVTRS